MTTRVVLAGATGDLGARILRELRHLDTEVRVLTRPSAKAGTFPAGVEVVQASYSDQGAMRAAVAGADVVVSALSGAHGVIIDAQQALLDAAIAEDVSRFIPSDYSADYRRVPPGTNRNFELRREFAARLDASPIRATSVLNGAFTDMLTGQAPLVLSRLHRVLFWSNPDQLLDFTSKDDTAWVVARAAVDLTAPRFIEVAGDRVTARRLAATMSAITGEFYRPLFAGTAGVLSGAARIARKMSRNEEGAFPAWQGMQYLVSMFSGDAALMNISNDRYGEHVWTSAADVLRGRYGRSAVDPADNRHRTDS